MVVRGDWGGGGRASLEGSGEQGGRGIQHTPTYTRGDPERATNTRGSRSSRQPLSLHISAEGSKLIWRTPNSPQTSSQTQSTELPLPFSSIWETQQLKDDGGREGSRSGEKSTGCCGEKPRKAEGGEETQCTSNWVRTVEIDSDCLDSSLLMLLMMMCSGERKPALIRKCSHTVSDLNGNW